MLKSIANQIYIIFFPHIIIYSDQINCWEKSSSSSSHLLQCKLNATQSFQELDIRGIASEDLWDRGTNNPLCFGLEI